MDVYMPIDSAASLIHRVSNSVPISTPLWLCPVKGSEQRQPLSPHGHSPGLFCNVGIYGRVCDRLAVPTAHVHGITAQIAQPPSAGGTVIPPNQNLTALPRCRPPSLVVFPAREFLTAGRSRSTRLRTGGGRCFTRRISTPRGSFGGGMGACGAWELCTMRPSTQGYGNSTLPTRCVPLPLHSLFHRVSPCFLVSLHLPLLVFPSCCWCLFLPSEWFADSFWCAFAGLARSLLKSMRGGEGASPPISLVGV